MHCRIVNPRTRESTGRFVDVLPQVSLSSRCVVMHNVMSVGAMTSGSTLSGTTSRTRLRRLWPTRGPNPRLQRLLNGTVNNFFSGSIYCTSLLYCPSGPQTAHHKATNQYPSGLMQTYPLACPSSRTSWDHGGPENKRAKINLPLNLVVRRRCPQSPWFSLKPRKILSNTCGGGRLVDGCARTAWPRAERPCPDRFLTALVCPRVSGTC